jgi:hypothetical protein
MSDPIAFTGVKEAVRPATPVFHLELLAGDAADHGLAAVVAVPRLLQLLPKLPDGVALRTTTPITL